MDEVSFTFKMALVGLPMSVDVSLTLYGGAGETVIFEVDALGMKKAGWIAADDCKALSVMLGGVADLVLTEDPVPQ